MTDVLQALLTDLLEETGALDAVLDGLAPDVWRTPTPAEGWTVHDQVGHLAYFDDATTTALTDPTAFALLRQELLTKGDDFPDRVVDAHRDVPVADLRAQWHDARPRLLDALGSSATDTRIPWFGPDMSVTSAATARLMETWAHGRDVCDAVGVEQPSTDRLRHVAHLGVRTRGFSYSVRGLDPPLAGVRVELAAPSGGTWTWGPADAVDRVTGPAEDFCLVVTQRRHRDDTDLTTTGPVAAEWLGIAQAFAGAPGPGRPLREPTT